MTDLKNDSLGERELQSLLKRIDKMVPVEESEQRLTASSRRTAYGRLIVAIAWVVAFSTLWAILYYNTLIENSDSFAYVFPRLSISVGLIASVVLLRMTDRLALKWALIAAVAIMVISRSMV